SGVQVLDLTGVGIDALNAPADVVRRLRSGKRHAEELLPLEAAVVADIHFAIGADGGAVGSTAGVGHDVNLSVRRDATERAALDLDEQHTAIGHGNRAFGELQATGDLTEVRHRDTLQPAFF